MVHHYYIAYLAYARPPASYSRPDAMYTCRLGLFALAASDRTVQLRFRSRNTKAREPVPFTASQPTELVNLETSPCFLDPDVGFI
ncbi:hypothetical protein PILCRDRAFT_812138 [Piloderma croceum F 1598]|uniref:Uncharacterized protein n=1 Tax=Piloderma croceum (strain F 1598) TaxID=765440 RepID=A0A0C3G210_PILCF|nr:hypothetical protein PILCRDRAFT_812138 [Piloderma croceum F 1598]